MASKDYSMRSIVVLTALTGAMAGAALQPISAAAQAVPAAPTHQMMQRAHHIGHVEGHIAFLKAELQITPAQEALFATVADAMRADITDLEQQRRAIMDHARTHANAVQMLERRAALSAARAGSEARFLAAFRPLYDALSPAQKQVADELLTQRGSDWADMEPGSAVE